MKNSIVNIEKRQKDILERLQQKEQMTTYELAESLKVSISTIRRDLNLLEEKMRSFVITGSVFIIMIIVQTLINLHQND